LPRGELDQVRMVVMQACTAQFAMLYSARSRTARTGELAQNAKGLLKTEHRFFRHSGPLSSTLCSIGDLCSECMGIVIGGQEVVAH